MTDQAHARAKLIYEQWQATALQVTRLAEVAGALSQQQQAAMIQVAAESTVKSLNELAVVGGK